MEGAAGIVEVGAMLEGLGMEGFAAGKLDWTYGGMELGKGGVGRVGETGEETDGEIGGEGVGLPVRDCKALILRTNASTSSFAEAGGISVRIASTRAFADD